jgi:hypothetical protein
MGTALLPFGSKDYLAGSMMNFLNATNASGYVEGALLPSGGTGTIYHAKPVIIQGAWVADQNSGGAGGFAAYKQQMQDLLSYWETRRDNATGLYVWYDQLESGEDNLVLSTCHSKRSPCWDEKYHALAIASPDLMTFMFREWTGKVLGPSLTPPRPCSVAFRFTDLSPSRSASLRQVRDQMGRRGGGGGRRGARCRGPGGGHGGGGGGHGAARHGGGRGSQGRRNQGLDEHPPVERGAGFLPGQCAPPARFQPSVPTLGQGQAAEHSDWHPVSSAVSAHGLHCAPCTHKRLQPQHHTHIHT